VTHAATPPETPTALPAAEAFAQEVALLSDLEALSAEFARAFQAHGLTALREKKDLAEAGAAETRFSHLFLGIRRSIALKARLHEQRQEARHAAEDRWDEAQAERAERRRAVARGVIQAIDAATPDAPEAREKLTSELWERLGERDRIDIDRADTVLPIEALIRQMCRTLGIKPEEPAFAAGTKPEDEDPAGEADILSVAGVRFRRGRRMGTRRRRRGYLSISEASEQQTQDPPIAHENSPPEGNSAKCHPSMTRLRFAVTWELAGFESERDNAL